MFKKLVFILLSLLPFFVEGQSFYAMRRPRNFTVHGGTGIASYKGELVNPQQLGKVRYNIVVGAEYLFSRRFSVKSELTWFRLSGTDKTANDDRTLRNLSFFSNNQELSLAGVVHLLREDKLFSQRIAFNMYAFGGVGFLHFNPKAEYEGKNYALQPLETEGNSYSRLQLSIPYGIGFKFQITPVYNIVLEGGYRTTFTDRLDDISIRRYPDPATLQSDLSRALSKRGKAIVRGNPKENDGYFLMNVKLQYYLPKQVGPNRESNKFYKKKRKGKQNKVRLPRFRG